jgi:hypothetical protein
MPSWQLTTRLPVLRKGRFPQPWSASEPIARQRTAAMQIQQNAKPSSEPEPPSSRLGTIAAEAQPRALVSIYVWPIYVSTPEFCFID